MLVGLLGVKVKRRRLELGITQSTLAELAEVSQNTIYQFEKGKNNPSLKVVEKILEVLGLELNVRAKSVEL